MSVGSLQSCVRRALYEVDPKKYLRVETLPHIWCAGCGNGILLQCFVRTLAACDIDPDKLIVISGIGCAGRITTYIDACCVHTTHGRTLPFATAVSLCRPDAHVVVISGDGDLAAIGGNHLIHAARRNVDVLVICVNNFNYGMTGGQYGPTTPEGSHTKTTPYGTFEPPFNLVDLVASAGAAFVARWTAAHPVQMIQTLIRAFNKKGFRFIEYVSPCPEYFGRLNKMGKPQQMLRVLKQVSVVKHGVDPSEATMNPFNRIVVGEFLERTRPTFTDKLREVVERARRR